jgi:hypothetical protein
MFVLIRCLLFTVEKINTCRVKIYNKYRTIPYIRYPVPIFLSGLLYCPTYPIFSGLASIPTFAILFHKTLHFPFSSLMSELTFSLFSVHIVSQPNSPIFLPRYCEGCVVSRLPPPGFELQISRLPGKGGYSTRPSGTTNSLVILVWS